MKKHIIYPVLALIFLPFTLTGCEPVGNGETESIGSGEMFEKESKSENVRLYFIHVTDGVESVAAVTREIDIGHCIIESALISLLNGVTDEEKGKGYSSSIPAETELLSFEVQNGVAQCNFSRDIEPGGGSAWVTAIRNQITSTLRQFDEVDRVEIRVASKKIEVLQP